MILRARYAVSGTDAGYAPTSPDVAGALEEGGPNRRQYAKWVEVCAHLHPEIKHKKPHLCVYAIAGYPGPTAYGSARTSGTDGAYGPTLPA
eukprot:2408141-Rhodomonas_salina.1